MAFQQSDPKIYKSMKIKGLMRDWHDNDPFRRLAPLASKGYYWDVETKRLKKAGPFSVSTNTPWCHARGGHHKNCLFDHHVAFDLFGIIPPRCQECWKVVVTPRNFQQLIELEALQLSLPETVPCKCGIELRDYTSKHYGGYFYTNSFDEGRDRYEQVVQWVSEALTNGPEIAETVILKRGCTEFEMIKGPAPYWHMTKEEAEQYELLEAYVDNHRNLSKQPDMVKNHVRQKWALWAHANGDLSYVPYNGGVPLFPGYVRFHEGDRDAIKADLAMAKAKVLGNIDGEVSFKFLKVAQDFADKNDVNIGDLVHTLGSNHLNPLKQFVHKDVEPEVAGGGEILPEEVPVSKEDDEIKK
jgi:hypothetical protein